MGEERKKRLLRLLKQRRENTRGNNSFCIIVTSKYSNQAFKKAENNHPKRHRNLSEGNFSAIYVIIKLAPSPTWTCNIYPIPTITNVFLNPPSLNPSSPPCLDWEHNDDNVFHSPPLSPLLSVHRQGEKWQRECTKGGMSIPRLLWIRRRIWNPLFLL